MLLLISGNNLQTHKKFQFFSINLLYILIPIVHFIICKKSNAKLHVIFITFSIVLIYYICLQQLFFMLKRVQPIKRRKTVQNRLRIT